VLNAKRDGQLLFEGHLGACDSDDRDKMVREFDWLRHDDPVRMPEP
jgi:hypothetical protein